MSGKVPPGVGYTGPYQPVLSTANLTAARTYGLPNKISGTIQVDDAVFNPADISGLKLWIDAQQPLYTASYAAQCASNGDQIGVVPDCSGNYTNITASATKPTYSPTGLNNKPCINFAGNSYLTVPSFFTTAYDTATTIFVVSESTDTVGAQFILASSVTNNFVFDLNTSTKIFGYTAAGLSANATLAYAGNNGVSMFRYDGAEATVGRHGSFMYALSSTCSVKSLPRTGNLGLNGQTLAIGATPSGSGKFQGKIGEVLVYNAVLTDAQVNQVLAYLASKWTLNKTLVLCGGDSITSGSGSTSGASQTLATTGNNYPCVLWNTLGTANYDVRVDAYPGRTISQMLTESPLFADVLMAQYSSKRIYIMLCGTNTLSTDKSAGSTIQKYVRFCRARRASGFLVIAGTLTASANAGLYAGWGNDRDVVNNYIRNNWRSFADGIADFGAAPQLQNPSDTTYYDADKLHFKDAGYAVIAGVAASAVATVMAL